MLGLGAACSNVSTVADGPASKTVAVVWRRWQPNRRVLTFEYAQMVAMVLIHYIGYDAARRARAALMCADCHVRPGAPRAASSVPSSNTHTEQEREGQARVVLKLAGTGSS